MSAPISNGNPGKHVRFSLPNENQPLIPLGNSPTEGLPILGVDIYFSSELKQRLRDLDDQHRFRDYRNGNLEIDQNYDEPEDLKTNLDMWHKQIYDDYIRKKAIEEKTKMSSTTRKTG